MFSVANVVCLRDDRLLDKSQKKWASDAVCIEYTILLGFDAANTRATYI